MPYLRIAIRNLWQAKRRSGLLIVALAMVTMLLVLLLSLSRGLTDTLIRAATTLVSGHINVSGFYKDTPEDAAPLVTGVGELRRIVEESTPGLAYALDRHRGWAKMVSDTDAIQTGLVGVDLGEERQFHDVIEILDGDATRIAEAGQALIFKAQADRLEVRVGDPLTLVMETMRGHRNSADVVVAAIAKDIGFMSNWNAFMSKETILDLYQLKPDTAGAVQVFLDDIEDAPEVMAQLRDVFESKGYRLMEHDPKPFYMKFETVSGEDWTGQKLDLTLWSDEVAFMMKTIQALDSLSVFLSALLMVVIALGIMNTMWMAVRERTGEIGTLRAIGMSRRRVLWMLLIEAAVLGFVGTLAGGLLGAGIALGVDAAHLPVPVDAIKAMLMSDTIHLVVRASHVLGAVTVFTLITALSALWPALRASRMQPVTAIHHIA